MGRCLKSAGDRTSPLRDALDRSTIKSIYIFVCDGLTPVTRGVVDTLRTAYCAATLRRDKESL
eukprot:scaffold5353_cov134-Isochrysis_galbana.AAC.7